MIFPFPLLPASLRMLLEVDEEGVVVEDDVLFVLDDEDELLLEEVTRSRLKMQRIAPDSDSPMVER
jgi:hypothetical protein